VYRHVMVSPSGMLGPAGQAAAALGLIGNAEKKLEECPYYERGMCKSGVYQCGFGHFMKM